jgi:hypothetical protein
MKEKLHRQTKVDLKIEQNYINVGFKLLCE